MAILNRRKRFSAAAQHGTYWRLIPLFPSKPKDGEPDPDALPVEAGGQSYVMHTLPNDTVVVQLPAEACTLAQAQTAEKDLTLKLQRDVVVTSDNVKFFRIERVSRAEMAGMLKGNIE